MTTEIGLLLCFAPLEGYALPGLTRIGGGSAKGTLHDDGGFPAVVHGGDGVVHGTLWSVDEDVRDEVLATIDLVHGIGGDGSASPHARTIIVEGGRLLVHSWHWRGTPPSPPIASGTWIDPQAPLPLTGPSI